MAAEPNLSLRWRGDLSVTARNWNGKPGRRLIEDPLNGAFHRLGEREFAVARRLDGVSSPQGAMQTAVAEEGLTPFTAAELDLFVRRLIELRLVEVLDANGAAVRLPDPPQISRFDPFFVRLPLFAPQRFLDALLPWTSFLFTARAAVVTSVIGAALAATLCGRYQELRDSLAKIFLPEGQLALVLCWLILKVVHETAHGLACRKFGGYVREAGLSLLFFAPAPYVDVTSVWRLASRRQRIAVSAAGMCAELLVAIACGGMWLVCESPAIRQACANVILLASVGTIFFNANPLLRFDGYFMLSDWLDFPNLYAVAQRRIASRTRQIMLGEPMPADGLHGSSAMASELYGAASWLWRWSSLAVLAITVISLYHGVGLALVLLAFGLWFGRSLWRCGQSWAKRGLPPFRLRPLFVTAAGLAVAYLLATVIREPFAPRSPGVVRLAEESWLRASSPGFVRKLYVRDGERVTAGQRIAELENLDLEAELRQAAAEEGRSIVKARMLEQQRDLVEWQVELARGAALAEKRAELSRRVAALELRAPTAGRIFARRLDESVGRFLAAGDLLCVIGDDARLEVRASIPQDAAPQFAAAIGSEAGVTAADGSRFKGELVSLEPRATREIVDPVLAATNGGGIGVREVRDPVGKASRLESLEPRFTAVIRTQDGAQPATGQRCNVYLSGAESSLADRLWILVRDKWRATTKRG